MLTSLALIFLLGLAMAALCQQLRLPRPAGETGRRSVGNRKECHSWRDYASFPDSRP